MNHNFHTDERINMAIFDRIDKTNKLLFSNNSERGVCALKHIKFIKLIDFI